MSLETSLKARIFADEDQDWFVAATLDGEPQVHYRGDSLSDALEQLATEFGLDFPLDHRYDDGVYQSGANKDAKTERYFEPIPEDFDTTYKLFVVEGKGHVAAKLGPDGKPESLFEGELSGAYLAFFEDMSLDVELVHVEMYELDFEPQSDDFE